MLVIALKFLEVGSRAVFIILTSFSLNLEHAGQFGLVLTILGLASFAFGYERQVDLMRSMVGSASSQFDRAVSNALWLFGVNYLLGVPSLVVILAVMVLLPAKLILLCVIIAIAEHLMNIAYSMALVEPRYRIMLLITVLKNMAIAITVVTIVMRAELDISLVLTTWAFFTTIGFLVISLVWAHMRQNKPEGETVLEVVARQYRASWTHFLLGLTAILTLQVDRLVVGSFLSLEEAGIYFRHVLLVSMLYQIFNIAFHNRILPKVFAVGSRGDIRPLLHIVKYEYLLVLGFWFFCGFTVIALHMFLDRQLVEQFSLVSFYLLGLLVVSAFRTRADLYALVFNALHFEKKVFWAQLFSFGLSLPILFWFANTYAIPGMIIASGISAIVYLGLILLQIKKLKKSYHD